MIDNKCENKTIWKSDLIKHEQPKHKGVKYECDQCEYKSTLQCHKKSRHEGVGY